MLEDAQWRHLASAGSGSIPASARGIVESGAPGRAQRVAAGNRSAGWLSLFGDDGAADADLLLRLTAAAIGIEFARNGLVSREKEADIWEALLARTFHDATQAREEAAARGIALAPHYLAVALEAETGDAERSAGDLTDVRELATAAFRSADGDLGLLQHGAALAIFVPTPRAVDASNAKTAASLLAKKRRATQTAASDLRRRRNRRNTVLLDVSVHAAQAALAIGRRIYGSGRIAVYDDLGAYRVLYEGADVERLRAFAAEALAPLRRYDEKHQTELERTLKLYFKTGQNVKTAAAELNVHRHTVFYRLRQIGEISRTLARQPARSAHSSLGGCNR